MTPISIPSNAAEALPRLQIVEQRWKRFALLAMKRKRAERRGRLQEHQSSSMQVPAREFQSPRSYVVTLKFILVHMLTPVDTKISKCFTRRIGQSG